MILRKLQNITKVAIPQPEFEAVRVLKELRHVTVNDEGTAVFEMHMENLSPDKSLMQVHNFYFYGCDLLSRVLRQSLS